MSSSASPDIVTNGLVLCLDAADKRSYPGSGTTWFDRSGRGNNGTLINSPTYDSNNGGSIVFNGTNNYVSCGNIMPLNAYTKCIFFKILNLGAPNNLMSGGNDGTHYFYPAAGSYLKAGHFQDGEVTSNTPILANTWYHGVVTFSTTLGFSIYQNGINVGNLLATANFAGGNILHIGSYTTQNYLLNGIVSSAQVYNRVLTPQEIKQNFNATKSKFNIL